MHDFFSAIVFIAIIVAVVYLRSIKHRGAADDRLLPGSRETELEGEVAELRQRIAVLERIATDERKSRSIAAEIEALRDRV
jgi:hypothetical protein